MRCYPDDYMAPDKRLISMEVLQEIVESVCYTAPVANTIPLSAMLIGPPGTGKSKVIMQYNSPCLHPTNDLTSSGLSEILGDDREGLIRHLVIPDFNVVVSHKQSTATLTIASLLSVMSEGTMRVDDGRRVKELVHAPVGVITAMTRDVYEIHAKKFLQLGIGRRFIPLFFTYSLITREKIQAEIANGTITLQQLIPAVLDLPPHKAWPVVVSIHDKESQRIRALSVEMSSNLSYQPRWERDETSSWVIRPFRSHNPIEFTPHMILRTLAQGHALRAKRIAVHDEDVEFLVRFVMYTNYSLPVQL
jgi:hypothetical protein